MNQCANARAASLQRCKRMARSPSPPLRTFSPSRFLDLLHFLQRLPFPLTLSLSLSNCYLSLISTITAVFTFHFSLTHLLFSLTLLFVRPSPVLLSYSFISFSVHFAPVHFALCSPVVLHLLVPSFLLSASLLLQFFFPPPPSSPELSILSRCFQRQGKEKKKRAVKIEERKKKR